MGAVEGVNGGRRGGEWLAGEGLIEGRGGGEWLAGEG